MTNVHWSCSRECVARGCRLSCDAQVSRSYRTLLRSSIICFLRRNASKNGWILTHYTMRSLDLIGCKDRQPAFTNFRNRFLWSQIPREEYWSEVELCAQCSISESVGSGWCHCSRSRARTKCPKSPDKTWLWRVGRELDFWTRRQIFDWHTLRCTWSSWYWVLPTVTRSW